MDSKNHAQHTEESLQRYVLRGVVPTDKDLGVGGYRRVFEVQHCGMLYAAKEVHAFLLDDIQSAAKIKADFIKACHFLNQCRHPNIVEFIGVYYPSHQRGRIRIPTLVMEKMDRYLSLFVDQNHPIPLHNVLSILHDISLGLWYLHSHDPPFLHAKLSPNNVLVNTTSLMAKICDSTAMTIISPFQTHTTEYMTKVPGYPDFMPPEAFKDKPWYGQPLDVFSFGGVGIFVATGEWPTPAAAVTYQKKDRVFSEVQRRKKYLDKMISDVAPLRPLLENCLEDNPVERPTMEEVSTMIKRLMRCHPNVKLQNNQMDITSTLKLFQIDGISVPRKNHIKEIGSGAYGRVLEVMSSCAAKELHANLIAFASRAELENMKQSFLQECVQCSKLYHPNIVQFLGVYYPSEDATLPWLVMEKLDTSLAKYLDNKQVDEFPFAKKISILHDVAQGLHYLHTLDIVHRDLSSNNVLLTKSLIAKIADLGVAKLMKDPKFSKTHTQTPGTPVFMPPEALRTPPRYGKPVDIFSLACVSLHLMTHEFPMPLDETYVDEESGRKIARLEIERREKHLAKLQAFPKLRELTLKCLSDIPGKRPEIDEVYMAIKKIAPELKGYEMQIVLSRQNHRIKELEMQLKQIQDKSDTVTAESYASRQQVKDLGEMQLKQIQDKSDTVTAESYASSQQVKDLVEEKPFTVALPPKPRKIAPELIPYCTKIAESSDELQIFQINLHTSMSSASQHITKKHFYDPVTSGTSSHYPGSDLPKHNSIMRGIEKVFMVVGATGAGKTTLINAMINYILGVEWRDNFRFQLITDETTQNQVHSQTQKITIYTIHHFKGSPIPYTLTIIDTPGFGDTRGLERDKVIVDQIRELFSLKGNDRIDHLDGIGFVTQSALARLTASQTYIFDSILSVFGKDVANNIFIMTTFSEGCRPPVLDIIEGYKIPLRQNYRFNNSAIFDSDKDMVMHMYWKMGFASFKKFFDGFSKTCHVSLSLSKDVLEERKCLQILVQELRPLFDDGLAKHLEKGLDRVKEEVRLMILNVQKGLNYLDKIALKPDPLKNTLLLEILIEYEKQQKKLGYEKRIQLYEEAKKDAEIFKKAEEAPRPAQFSTWRNLN